MSMIFEINGEELNLAEDFGKMSTEKLSLMLHLIAHEIKKRAKKI